MIGRSSMLLITGAKDYICYIKTALLTKGLLIISDSLAMGAAEHISVRRTINIFIIHRFGHLFVKFLLINNIQKTF
jgi:hypothetical protein